MKLLWYALAIALCLAVGTLAGVIAYRVFGDKQPFWTLLSFGAFAYVTGEIIARKVRRP